LRRRKQTAGRSIIFSRSCILLRQTRQVNEEEKGRKEEQEKETDEKDKGKENESEDVTPKAPLSDKVRCPTTLNRYIIL